VANVQNREPVMRRLCGIMLALMLIAMAVVGSIYLEANP
jgi:hypothetical protein